MDTSLLKELILNNWGKILGAICGLLLGLLFILYGFWKTLLIIGCLAAGIFLGFQLEKNQNFKSWLDKIGNNK
ncbi:DUF2273 domain-containing protein [Candidatus Contubernalis alkalaceticus]|uniref:DUF2273 domain-containing protein n=1 Tax=Candidatus Contubernalis alkaliaceticus TaxID=338645 RepID=UPI00387EE2BE|nr:DUF2273 domain-containing protein [Candidatus Contubernalis alkalaceticus]